MTTAEYIREMALRARAAAGALRRLKTAAMKEVADKLGAEIVKLK